MNFFRFILQDQKANKGNTKGKIVTFFFRIANYSTKSKIAKVLLFPYNIFYKIVFEWILGFEIQYGVTIAPGLKISHLQAIVINQSSVIGNNCNIRQCLTIGNNGINKQCPVIGNNVNIGAHVCIIGPIVIGNNVIIGAGSVVVKNVPSNVVVAGNPARIIRELEPQMVR